MIKKKKLSLTFWLIIIIALVIGLTLGGLGIHSILQEKREVKEPFNWETLKEVQVKAAPSVLFLVEKEKGCLVLPIYVSLEQSALLAGSITNPLSRPLTHDLLRNVLESLEAELLGVEVIDQREGAYYANLVLGKGDKIIRIDSRPSDAIILAGKMDKPVYVKKELFSEGINLCRQENEEEEEESFIPFHTASLIPF